MANSKTIVSASRVQLVRILATMAVVFGLDQITKAIVVAIIPQDSVHPSMHMGEFFWFSHARNDALVGGLGQGYPFLVFMAPLVACVVLIYLYRHLHAQMLIQHLAYGMVAGGAAGNLVDRLVRGTVVDFLQFHFYFIPFNFPWKLYPAFNVADTAICIGVFLLVVTWHKAEQLEEKNAPSTV